ncbi:hypothetical protein HYFRA_00011112 [Hymenoscyphus fraxineus]|uniref:Polyketide synthase n=1 Tax=Hymenoscyphus fraxineus TaxID=746836 RepID=A0A9N9L1F6_9HELO|nr:hypothetical protein HYFRA_00011112 [Hymenoscyphus fraxineus]
MTTSDSEPIAIIGMACRFPGQSNTPARLWDLLKEPRDILKKIPVDRFNPDGFYNSNSEYHGNSNVVHSYFLEENVRQFDASFFGTKPVEADAMDPQQRILLETVYEALEAGGQKMEALQGSNTAIYVGLSCGDYDYQLLRDTDNIPTYHATGIARSIMSNRVSYFFDWNGPSMTIDTACSSSLVALHQAVQVLRSGTSRLAVAAGSNLILGPENYIAESKLKMLSPTGRSRMWDADADGYARGEGVATVVLKRLSDAIRDNDIIECVVRETGINQDGRTNGITMPNPVAQANLVRQVYSKAGLDPRKEEDRCQFFECHGTGTPTGDPIEAEAIRDAFFGTESFQEPKYPLYVGSIKTVIGHTEATAGLAGLIKASLAMKNGVIPPNMLFNRLNPSIEPFYGGLQLPTVALPWPQVAAGQPRRASVNSFGFGGANAHVILESYESKQLQLKDPESARDQAVFSPFLFSAKSQRSLRAMIGSYSRYLKENRLTDLGDLAWTLNSRRSVLPVRASFSATDLDTLIQKLDAASSSKEMDSPNNTSKSSRPLKYLGVFTGQGAQWASMGRELVRNSEFVRLRLQHFDAHLQKLPAEDRPSWSLLAKLQDGEDVSEAYISQPLCTIVQLILVDLLRAAGVQFHAVVGHSSGEISAAYAAGFISAEDASCIAYYRGRCAALAKGPNGMSGKMMAVATSPADAEEVCNLPHFHGRICVAAKNSHDSVTLSGDADAISEAQTVFEDEEKTAKILFVDRAYHSHHMMSAADEYGKSLKSFSPCFRPSSEASCKWFSSVYNEEVGRIPEKLNEEYWNANMIGTVLFADAIERACAECGPFDAVVEVGPHPALKRPVLTVIEKSSGVKSLPYTGVLQRGQNDLEAFSAGLGILWRELGENAVNIKGYEDLISGTRQKTLLEGLPTYSWDKEREYWHESRVSKGFRLRSSPTHELLGNLLPDGTDGKHYRWRNLLSVRELPWLDNHQVQGQAVFPAAGYVCMALEASQTLVASRTAKLVEVLDVTIHNALAFPGDDVAVETLFTLTNINEGDDVVQADFAIYATVGKQAESLAPKASGILKVLFGEPSGDVLPPRQEPEPMMVTIDSDRFYSSLSNVGFGYTGPFHALTDLSRKAGIGSGMVRNIIDAERRPMVLHPALLDSAFQAIILAYCYPDDGRLSAIHVPKTIKSIRINPALCAEHLTEAGSLPFDSAETACNREGVFGDVDIFSPTGEHAMVQVQSLQFVRFAEATPEDDIKVFSTTVWGPATPDLSVVCWDGRATEDECELARDLERVCVYYLNQWEREIPLDHPARTEGAYKGLFRFSSHIRAKVLDGKHKYTRPEYMDDDQEVIRLLKEKHNNCLDMRMVETVGENIPAVVRGETTILEHMFKDDLLAKFYSHSLGMRSYIKYLGRGVQQITHRYPAMKILEVGGGTGHATQAILNEIGGSFGSYQFTDISSGFFEKAQARFEEYSDRMSYKVLDLEKDVLEQGFSAHSYDLVVASFVLHATASIEKTLRQVRHLLKPGGYLVMAEMTDNEPIRTSFTYGSLPGWWVGEGDGRILSPCVEPVVWDQLLRATGFSGIDTITEDMDTLSSPASIMISQAIDDRITLLRNPTAPTEFVEKVQGDLIIIGGSSLKTSRLVQQIKPLVNSWFQQVTCIRDVAAIKARDVTPTTSILNLSDLDQPLFADLTQDKFDGLKAMVQNAKAIVWLTQGRRAQSPHANMSVGFMRSIFWEIPEIRLASIDVENANASEITDALLRLELVTRWKAQGQTNLSEEMLWSTEWEIAHTNDGVVIPRLVENIDANRRYNSISRRISEDVDPSKFALSAVYEGEGSRILLEKGSLLRDLREHVTESSVLMHVKYSSALSIPVGKGSQLFALLGTDDETGGALIAFSEITASSVTLPRSQTKVLTLEGIPEAPFFSALVDNIVATYLVSDLARDDTLHLHEPNTILASVVSRRAAAMGINVKFTTVHEQEESGWTLLPPRLHQRFVRQKLPQSIQKFVDFSSTLDSREIAQVIQRCIPRCCKQESSDSIFQRVTHISRGDTNEVLQECLSEASSFAHSDMASRADVNANTIVMSSISDLDKDEVPAPVIAWQAVENTQPLPVTIRPADSKPLFAADRSYWLVGLTGDLGLSICEWMIRLGARYVVLSSRQPRIDEKWLAKVRRAGATVKVLSCDVTSMLDLRKCYNEISTTMPPVAGVAQGAMVLQDSTLPNMDLKKMTDVLGPKVQGSINLESLFSTCDLDFFIYFSSMAGLIGNLGQSNYSAANAFLMSLAAQRRKRGLSASVINIGVIVGVGYITREVSNATLEDIKEGGYMWLPEQAFHQIFAEGIIAGRKDSGLDPEVSTGVSHIKMTDERKPLWFDNPRFSHHLLHSSANDVGKSTGVTAAPLKTQLQEALTKEEVFRILKDAFLVKLQNLLKFDPSEGRSEDAVLALQTDDLGLDSLIAVEIRTWFLKNLQVNVPVLKVLGGASIGEILNLAFLQLSKDFTPRVAAEIAGSDERDTEKSDDNLTQSLGEISNNASSHNASEITHLGSNSSADWESIEKKEVEEEPSVPLDREGPLSHGQSMFWFVHLFTKDATTLNHTGSSRIRGSLRIADLTRAVTEVSYTHEILRTCFQTRPDSSYFQGVMGTPRIHLETRNITHESEVSQTFSELHTAHVYNLEKGETMRIILLTKSSSEHYLLVGCHHIIMDGLSSQIFMRDLERAYNHQHLREPLQYLDFTLREREEYLDGAWNQDMAYWKNVFRDIPPPLPVLPLPDSKSRIRQTNYEFHRVSTRLSRELTSRITQQSRTLKVTPFHFYLAAFRTLVARFTDTEDFCVGIATGNRANEDLLDGIGPYVNLLPLRFTKHLPDEKFLDVLQDTRKKTLAALAHSRLPFGALIDELHMSRSEYHSPLFQTFVDYREGAKESSSFGGAQMDVMDFETGKTAYDINIDIADYTAGCKIDIMVQECLYSRNDAQWLMDSYHMILDTFSRRPTDLLFSPAIFSNESINNALQLGLGPSLKSSWPETLIHRIVDIAKVHKDDPALKDGYGSSLSYEQMFHRVQQIVAKLLTLGEKRGFKIAVFQERSVDWVCSLLAIMYVGAVYVPLDSIMPIERLSSIAGDCNPAAILFDNTTAHKLPGLDVKDTTTINVETLHDSAIGVHEIQAIADNPAAILYTSGSTGTPKGIQIKHSNLRNEVEFSASTYGFNIERVLQQSSFSFDMSLTQIFSALAFGGYVYICPSSLHGDPISLTRLMVSEQITMTAGTPSEYLSWINNGLQDLQRSPWKVAICGGESITDSLIRAFRLVEKESLHLFNAYGPTEVTCSSHRAEVNYSEDLLTPIPVGKAAPNTHVYIVDGHLHPLPIGFTGEIVIGGAGIALGYLNKPSETKLRFLPDPFVNPTASAFMHRTGDMGRLLCDGSLVVGGRIAGDTQIKLRGIRIDLQEIESAILKTYQGRVQEAVASVRLSDDGGPEFIVAHVVFSAETPVESRRLDEDLHLPQHMRPSIIINVDDLPRGSTGKVDRRAVAKLPLHGCTTSAPSGAEFSGKLNVQLLPEEAALLKTWSQVIPAEIFASYRIDMNSDSDFFHVGGSSLLLVQLQSHIHNDFGCHLDLAQMFGSSSLRGMVALIQEKKSGLLGESSVIDWDDETQLLDEVPPEMVSHDITISEGVPKLYPTIPKRRPEVVILTGATGFLGRTLLKQLVAEDTVRTIHCIAVRRPEALLSLNTDKISIFKGDLSQPALGLSDEDAARIFAEADTILHNAANVSHLKHYRTLQPENVLSTKELIKLALPRRIPIHYVSTAGVSLYSEMEKFGEISCAAFPPPANGVDGYTASKWASERLLEKACASYQLPVTIHRPSHVHRDDAAELDLIEDLLKFSRLLRAVPSSGKVRGFVHIISVDECARGIVGQMTGMDVGCGVRFLNHIGGTTIPLGDLKGYVERDVGEGVEVEVVSFRVWVERAVAVGLHATVASYFEGIENSGGIVYPLLVRGSE